MNLNINCFVVSHSHLDREWYKPFQHFRMRLVKLIDCLIETLENDPNFKYFMLDGQTIVLEDYFAIRPENEDKLRKLIDEGKVLIGPWYNLPDEVLVSGESLIRNLYYGHKICGKYESIMKVGYVPDQFGHISSLPQILRGFGIDNAVLFRGITRDQTESEFIWKSPDGSEVLAVKMPDNNAYSNWFYRNRETLINPDAPIDRNKVVEDIKAILEDCENERPTTNNRLFMDGCDHVFPQFKTPELIKIASEEIEGLNIEHSTLENYIKAVKESNPKLQTFEGELRWSNRAFKLQGLLAGTLSSRIHLKQYSHKCETLLEKYLEPLCAAAWWLGEDYPQSYIELAWKYLLKNSPHDSICGCSIDQVHKDMIYRYDQCRLISEELIKNAAKKIAAKINTETIKDKEKSDALVVFNTLGFERSEIIETELDIPTDQPFASLEITDADGNIIPYEILDRKLYGLMEPEPWDIPTGRQMQKLKVVFNAEKIPGLGYKTYTIERLDKRVRNKGTLMTGIGNCENKHIALSVESNGSLSILDKETGKLFKNCLVFEDCGDVGDGYYHIKPANDKVYTSISSKCCVSVVENSPLRCTFEIKNLLMLPESSTPDNSGRSERLKELVITSYVTLAANSRRIDIKTIVNNNICDHRLRVLFPTGINTEYSFAEGAFDVIKRNIRTPDCSDWLEPMYSTHPQKTFVDVSDGNVGLCIINKGLPEYEIYNDPSRTIALTLLRGVRHGVGEPWNLVGGQILGEHVFEYAIYPHSGDWEEGDCWKVAHSFNTPMISSLTDIHSGNLPSTGKMININCENLLVSALKKSDDEEKLVVRFCNLKNKNVSASFYGDINGIELLNLTEKTADSKLSNDLQDLHVEPKKISTLGLLK
ncbi:MAG: glycoside hydrolase family 38 C-terminal domain-containing protein [Armatimonadota bacterium]